LQFNVNINTKKKEEGEDMQELSQEPLLSVVRA
jgi:hypothetical protein